MLRTEGLVKRLRSEFPQARVVSTDGKVTLSRRFPDGTSVIIEAFNGRIASVFYSRITKEAVEFVDEVKEFLAVLPVRRYSLLRR